MAHEPHSHHGATSMPSIADGDMPPKVAPALTVEVPDEAALSPLARRLTAALPPRAFIALEGEGEHSSFRLTEEAKQFLQTLKAPVALASIVV